MKILSIDTASNLCTVAVLENSTCLTEITIDDARNHSEKIMPVIENALNKTSIDINDINLIVCDKGPGSFTGIRIGIGTVLAFKDSLNIPCIGISSLESLAYNVKNNGIICSLIDAKNDNVYFGLFEKNTIYKQIEDFNFLRIDEIVPKLKKYSSITFVGDGALEHQRFLKENFIDCYFCDKNNLSSYSLGIAGLNKFNNKIESNLIPLYLRKSQAERALLKNNSEIS